MSRQRALSVWQKVKMQNGNLLEYPNAPYLYNNAGRSKLETDGRRLAHHLAYLHAILKDDIIAAIRERTNSTHNITWQLARLLRQGMDRR